MCINERKLKVIYKRKSKLIDKNINKELKQKKFILKKSRYFNLYKTI